MAIEKTIEKRVTDLESIYTDMPQLLNLRFDEVNGRLNLLDRQMATVIRDLRDIRGGVTRQLVAQDGEIAGLKTDMAGLKADMAGLNAKFDAQGSEMSGLKAMLAEVLARLPKP
jgi:hypothetical protein